MTSWRGSWSRWLSLTVIDGNSDRLGRPADHGLISAIIAGLLLPFLGGSYVTISGPAAGLAPAILMGMTVLAHGDAKKRMRSAIRSCSP